MEVSRLQLSALTDPNAVLAAIAEFDAIGQRAFLEKYGFGYAKSYLLVHNGRHYPSKAIAGVAVGKQFPELGPMTSADFSGGFASVVSKLRDLGFEVIGGEAGSDSRITSRDTELLATSRHRTGYANLTPDERAAHERVHLALGELGRLVVQSLGEEEYELRLTSSFHLRSGVRGAIPKDLWFGVYRKENKAPFLGNPQLYAIASGRGMELGFAASTHPSDFSDARVKADLREVAPKIYRLLPSAHSSDAETLAQTLGQSWKYRRKSRLDPGTDDFPDLHAWLAHFKSARGAKDGGGCIARYLTSATLDDTDVGAEVIGMASAFRQLMGAIASRAVQTSMPAVTNSETFRHLFTQAIDEYSIALKEPMHKKPSLWAAMDAVKQKLLSLPSIRARPNVLVEWSVGVGDWAKVPWIAVMNQDVTTSTQNGIYIVFLLSADLNTVYLTLNQGVADLVNELGPQAGMRLLAERGERFRSQIQDLQDKGFVVGNNIDLKTTSPRPKRYEATTIAYAKFAAGQLPSDEALSRMLDDLLHAYDRVVGASELDVPEALAMADTTGPAEEESESYSIDDAMSGLFLSRSEVERVLNIWKNKKNLILQGAPGVGKSFVARRLAYALMERRAPSRVEVVQFHQSYSYEDFVQGYRPTPTGGFELRDGLFVRFCQAARANPADHYVLIIDEINRANLSKVFGELLLLLEQDKRSPTWATRLAYQGSGSDPFYVPDNLYLVGLMNTADRSLSMVDYALRRRFAFVSLLPAFGSSAFGEHLEASGVEKELITRIVQRMSELNEAIASDTTNLGPGFQVGHSFFVPPEAGEYSNEWYHRVVETEIRPLLEEYWFDDPERATNWIAKLLKSAP